MKKILGIVVLSFMLSTSAKADLYELKIDLNTSEKITQDVRVRNGYSSKCRAELNESGSKMFLDINFYGFKNKINSEIILEIIGEGIFKSEYSTKITQSGTIEKSKFLRQSLTGSKDFKKEIKPYVKVFKNMGSLMFTKGSRHPEYGKPFTMNKEFFDGKKLFKKMLNLIAKSMPKQSSQLRKASSHILKNSEIEVSQEFIGYSIINGERYDLLNYNFIINYTGNKSEYRTFTKDFYFEQIQFIHSDSGLPSVVYDIVPNTDTWMNHSIVCGIYENNSLISEISIPMLKDASKLRKIKKKSKVKVENKDFAEQLKTLSELYKSGVLTKEEFTKAKKRLLN